MTIYIVLDLHRNKSWVFNDRDKAIAKRDKIIEKLSRRLDYVPVFMRKITGLGI